MIEKPWFTEKKCHGTWKMW